MTASESAIVAVVQDYFLGTYHGDPARIRAAFYGDAEISGSFKGQIVTWNLQQFIDRIMSMPIPAHQNALFDKHILFVDQMNEAAVVRAKVSVAGIVFTDYISLLKIDGQWKIRNKIFTT